MRRSRRGGSHGLEFGGSGEDSFVAVVVTKLTGALLFILLLTMVIMVLIPKAIDIPNQPSRSEKDADSAAPLQITTSETLPDAIAGRAYSLTLAASGGGGDRKWSLVGTLPEGLTFDPELGRIQGTPTKGIPEPVTLLARVSDGSKSDSKSTTLTIFKDDGALSLPSRWKPTLPPIPWRSWLDQGVGFLVLWMFHILAMNIVRSMERTMTVDATISEGTGLLRADSRRRFFLYRLAIRCATLAAMAGLLTWLLLPHH